MKVSEIVPQLEKRVQFTLRYRKIIPKEQGCYLLSTFEGDVLYVGLTNNLYERFAQHRDNKEKCRPTARGRAFWFYYLVCAEKELYRIERTWQNQHLEVHGVLPMLNKINSPIR